MTCSSCNVSLGTWLESGSVILEVSFFDSHIHIPPGKCMLSCCCLVFQSAECLLCVGCVCSYLAFFILFQLTFRQQSWELALGKARGLNFQGCGREAFLFAAAPSETSQKRPKLIEFHSRYFWEYAKESVEEAMQVRRGFRWSDGLLFS